MNSPIYGLVLTGGRSSRMQRDKAALDYHGVSQLEWSMSLLTPPHVARAFVSVRGDQRTDPLRSRFACIQDQDAHAELGPLAGILAAQALHPEVAWLVLACDLPFLDRATLLHLIAERQPTRLATAYRSTSDDAPEPLCAIYEPASRQPLLAYLERDRSKGKACPRGFLQRSDVALLDQPCWSALTNVNTVAEHTSALKRLGEHAKVQPLMSPSKHIRIQYFATLREQAALSEETVQTRARTPAELYAELRERHRFSLPVESLRVAVNDEFGDWAQALAEGDVVVFLPPVAGG